MIRFNVAYLEFFKKLYACPPDAKAFDDCRPSLGRFDAKLWDRVRKAARVFD